MGNYAHVIAFVLLITIPVFEFLRKKERIVDFLSLTNLVFLLAYGVAPIYIYFFEEYTTMETVKASDLNSSVFFYGELTASLFYIVFVLSYYLSSKLPITLKLKAISSALFSKNNNNKFYKVAISLFVIGGLSLLFYMFVVLDGFSNYIKLGPILRDNGNYIVHNFAFLKHFTLVLIVSSFMFYVFFIESKGKIKFFNFTLFFLSFMLAFLSVYHSSGRMSMFTFLITFPLAGIIHKNRISIKVIVTGFLLFIVLVLFGDYLLDVNRIDKVNLNKNSMNMVGEIIEEFSFPYTNIGNTISLFPSEYKYRGGFVDVVMAFTEYIPSRIINIGIEWQSPSDFNTSLYNTYGQIPVDIITFGYMSYGVLGVILVGITFGIFLKLIENLFSYTNSRLASILYVAFMILMSFRIMYGDPSLFLMSSFKYVVTFLIMIFLIYNPFSTSKLIKSK